MRIIVDVMGSDLGCAELVKGALDAKTQFGDELELTLVGKESEIRGAITANKADASTVTIVDAATVMDMNDAPTDVIKAKKDSSMAVALTLLRNGEGDGLVSCGNTGALLTGATMIVKRIKGVRRAALAPSAPNLQGRFLIIDSGANVECKPEYLLQFGLMGTIYASKVLKVNNPRVGLLNNGAEETKGTDLHIESHQLLKTSGLNFVGNIEGPAAFSAECDVLVSDGFSGNIFLKACEGMSLLVNNLIKDVFVGSFSGNIAALLVMKGIKNMRKKTSSKEVGGAPLLGVCKPVIKGHGNSDAYALKNAIKLACEYAKSGVIDDIQESVANYTDDKE